MPLHLPVTATLAALLTLGYLALAAQVIRLRGKHQVSLGARDVPELDIAIRAHGNFAEYAPLALILLALLELQGMPALLLAALGLAFAAGRLLHAIGIHEPMPHLRKRVAGMMLTLGSLAALALANAIMPWLR